MSPRRVNREEARTIQVTITLRPVDYSQWSEEAGRMGISLSRAIWLRAQAGRPLPSEGHMALARELNRVGVNLNQAIRRLHSEGASCAAVEDTLRAVVEIRQVLEQVP